MTTSDCTELRDRITAHLADPDADRSTVHLARMLGEGGAYGHQLVRLLLARHAERQPYGEGLWAHATTAPAGFEPVTGNAALKYARILACAAQGEIVTAVTATQAIEVKNATQGGLLLTRMGDQGFLARHRIMPKDQPTAGARVRWSLSQAHDDMVAGPLALPDAHEPLPGDLPREVAAWVSCIGATSLPEAPFLRKRRQVTCSVSRDLRERMHAYLAQRPQGTPTPQVLDRFQGEGANVTYHLHRLEKDRCVVRVKNGRAHYWYALASATNTPEESRATAREGSVLAQPLVPEGEAIAAAALDHSWRPVGTCGCHLAPANTPLPGDERAHRLREQAADSLTGLFNVLRDDEGAPEDVRTMAVNAAEGLLPVMRAHLAARLEEWAGRLEFTRPDAFAVEADHRLNQYRVSVLREVIDWLAASGGDDSTAS